jgi:hypothetical protein
MRMHYPAADYRLAVRDHYRLNVKYWQETDHWADRNNRKLRSRHGSCTKTEHIFHRSLARWLEQHLDGNVKSKPQDSTGDEPDIQIIALGGRVYLVEIKWLGCTEKNSKNGLDWLKDGLGQISQYLLKQANTNWGSLVVYDGRKKEEFLALTCKEELEEGCRMLENCKGVAVPIRGDCMVFFLESKNASQS